MRRRPALRPPGARAAKTRRAVAAERELGSEDTSLFEELRRWRAAKAREQGVPAYVILHDKTLRELAEIRPTSHGMLAGITGMGSAKIEHYGEELLALIREAG